MTIKKLFRMLILLLPLLVFLALAPASVAAQDDTGGEDDNTAQEDTTAQQSNTSSDNDILANLQADGRFETFTALIEAAAFADNLDRGGPFTIFAPTDAAFEAFDNRVEAPNANLTEILLYHVVNGNYPAAAVSAQDDFTTLLGSHLMVSSNDDGAATLDNAANILGSIPSTNGIIHVIDRVLVPGRTGTGAADVGDDTATGDDDTATGDETDVEETTADRSLTAVLEADGRFSTFLAVLNAAGLTDDLLNRSDFTLFAPTNAAFANLPEEFVNDLLADPQGDLDDILLYHVVGDSLSLNQVATDTWITTLEGRPIRVNTNEAIQVFLNGDARVIGGDIQVENGTVHVVDTVLVP